MNETDQKSLEAKKYIICWASAWRMIRKYPKKKRLNFTKNINKFHNDLFEKPLLEYTVLVLLKYTVILDDVLSEILFVKSLKYYYLHLACKLWLTGFQMQ